MNSGQTTTLAEYSEIDAGIAALKEKYADRVYEVTTTAGMNDARVARAEVRGQRSNLEKIRKAIKAPALEKCRMIDVEAKRISAALFEIETPIDELIKGQESIKAAEKQAREDIERKRIEGIQEAILQLKFTLSEYHPVNDLKVNLLWLQAVVIDGVFGEFQEHAAKVLEHSIAQCELALEDATNREAVKVALEAEREANLEKDALERAEKEKEREAQAEIMAKQQAKLDAEKEVLAKEQAKAEQEEIKRQDKADKAAKAKELLEAKCESHTEALKKILEVCHTETWSASIKVRRITTIAEANLRGKSSKP